MPLQTPAPPAPAIPIAPTAPVEAPAIAVQGPGAQSGLQAQAIELRVQLAGLQAQWTSLKSQLDQMLRNNPARPQVQQRWADVAVQKAQVEGDLARVEAQMAQQGGFPGVPGVPPRPPRFGRNSNSGPQIGAILFLVMLLPIAVAWGKRLARGSVRPASLSREATERLERMEQAIDTVAIEVERISEGQRFVTKILAERGRRAEAEAAKETAPAEQPMRALGAGPAELLQASERESVHEQVRKSS
jgi:hypothetical protein